VIVLKQVASGTLGTVAYPAAWNWPGGVPSVMPTAFGYRMRITISSDAAGVIDAAAQWMKAP
jgi:hypothetical protein